MEVRKRQTHLWVLMGKTQQAATAWWSTPQRARWGTPPRPGGDAVEEGGHVRAKPPPVQTENHPHHHLVTRLQRDQRLPASVGG